MDVPIAVFDLDKTLTVRDCVFPFMRRVGGVSGLVRSVAGDPQNVGRHAIARDRDKMKALFVRGIFRGLDVEDVDAEGVEFASTVATKWMRPDVAARLRWHQEQDHVVLIVSASLESYALPLGELLEVDDVLCTRLESVDGRFTGELLGANCRGAEKVARITQWCRQSGLPVESVQFAYGDSAGDQPMLRMASHSEMVTRIDLEVSPE